MSDLLDDPGSSFDALSCLHIRLSLFFGEASARHQPSFSEEEKDGE